MKLFIAFMVILVLSLGFVGCSLTCVPAGHVGVKTVFGAVDQQTVGEGASFVNPFAFVYNMSLQTRTIQMDAKEGSSGALTILSSDGLDVSFDASIIYRVVPADAAWVYQKVGVN